MTDTQQFWAATYTAAVARGFSAAQAKSAADDGTAAYMKTFPAPATPAKPPPKLVPVYRLRNGAEHFYTISETERDSSVSQYGYTLEGIAFYAYDSAGT
jgi:hypothetical protein